MPAASKLADSKGGRQTAVIKGRRKEKRRTAFASEPIGA